MRLESIASEGERVAVAPSNAEFEARLRVASGLHGGRGGQAADPRMLGYCGRDFRVYRWMQVGQAADFYAAMGSLDPKAINANLAIAHLSRPLQVGRMKRAYQRALVLAFVASADPEVLIVEGGEEFDEGPARALLQSAVRRARCAVVTFGDDVFEELAFTRFSTAAEFSGTALR